MSLAGSPCRFQVRTASCRGAEGSGLRSAWTTRHGDHMTAQPCGKRPHPPEHRHISASLSLPWVLFVLPPGKKHSWQLELLFSLGLTLSLPIKIKRGPKAYLVITSHSLGEQRRFHVNGIIVMGTKCSENGSWVPALTAPLPEKL